MMALLPLPRCGLPGIGNGAPDDAGAVYRAADGQHATLAGLQAALSRSLPARLALQLWRREHRMRRARMTVLRRNARAWDR